MSRASDLLTQYVAILEEYELKVEPLVDHWIDIQVQMKQLDPSTNRELFIPYEFNHDKSRLGFRVFDPDPDYYQGPPYIWIPADFFEDHTPYEEELKKYLETVEKNKKSVKRRITEQEVQSLERKLASAKAQLAGMPKND